MHWLVLLLFWAFTLHGHAQIGDKVRRMLNSDPNAPPPYDTNYVASYRSNLNLSLLVKYQSVDIAIEPDAGDDLAWSANTTEQYGLGLAFKWLSVEATFSVPALDDYDPAYGNSNSSGFGLGYTGRRLWARGFWNKTTGYYLNDPQRWIAAPTDKPVTRGDLSNETYMLSAKYALSGKKRFSQNAALYQMERQKRSAGTFVVGFSGWRTSVVADSSLLSAALVDTFGLATGFSAVERTMAGFTVGYAHTFSFWHKGFIHAALLPGVGYVHQLISTPGTGDPEGSGVGVITELKLGAGYNGNRWYTALSFAYFYSSTPIADQLSLGTNYGFGRFALGIRLGDPGIEVLEKVGL